MSKKKVVLAFSGGLDTSFAVKYLTEDLGYEVHTAIANTGGFTDEELEVIADKAKRLGATSHASLDITKDYYDRSIRYMVAGNVLRNGTYPISVSSERIFQAIAIIEYAKKIGADAVAHGSTGAGNDQVRFDLTFQILAPEIEIITPRGSDNARLWDTSNRSIQVVLNNLKGIFFEDDNMEHMAFSVIGRWGEKGATIIRILDFDKSQQIRSIT